MVPESTGMLPQIRFNMEVFAGSVAADYGDELAVGDAQVEILKEAHFVHGACIVIFIDVL